MIGRRAWPCLIGLLASSAGCTSELGGRASFPLVSRGDPFAGAEVVAKVDEQRCNYGLLLFFAWGEDANHEALVTDLLEKHQGDAIIDAELTFTFVPALIYTQQCARVTGTVVRMGHGAKAPNLPKEDT